MRAGSQERTFMISRGPRREVCSGRRGPNESASSLDAGLVRAHACADDAHAEWRARLARRQRRAGTPGRHRRPDPRRSNRVVPTVERLMREHRARRRRPVGHDVPAPHRAAARSADSPHQAVRHRRRRRLRSEPRDRGLRRSVNRRGRRRARRRRADVPGTAARALDAGEDLAKVAGLCLPADAPEPASCATPPRPGQPPRRRAWRCRTAARAC